MPGAATEQCVPWDRLSPRDCALAATVAQGRDWGAEKQTHPLGDFVHAHPAEVWDTVREQAAAAPPCRRGSTPDVGK